MIFLGIFGASIHNFERGFWEQARVEQKLQSGNLYQDVTINPGLGSARVRIYGECTYLLIFFEKFHQMKKVFSSLVSYISNSRSLLACLILNLPFLGPLFPRNMKPNSAEQDAFCAVLPVLGMQSYKVQKVSYYTATGPFIVASPRGAIKVEDLHDHCSRRAVCLIELS